MAYGTETVPKVYKILGPGNQYVTMAKKMVSTLVAIDFPAGPSEVAILGKMTRQIRSLLQQICCPKLNTVRTAR